MSKETEKVRRWRERMKAEGKQPVTVWLGGETIERLNTLAAEGKVTVSEVIERAVTVAQPKATGTVTDTIRQVTDTVMVIRDLVREEVERALSHLTVTKSKVTGKVTATKPKVISTVTGAKPKGKADVIAKKAELTKAARKLLKQGLSYEEIAERWTAEKIPTLKGGRWTRGTVWNLLNRPSKGGKP